MTEHPETVHLRRLVRLRYAVIAGQLTAVLGAHFSLGVPLPLEPMLAFIAALAALNLFTQHRLGRDRPVTPGELGWQLLADIGQLTALLYLSGGYANPFIFMLLPPLAIAAAALSARHAGWLIGATVLCYSFLMVTYVPLPLLDQLAVLTPTVLRRTGMWICFVASAGMIVFFVISTRRTLRAKDRELAQARERAMRNEHLAALGGVAAGTAHELGTPLATMSFIAEELEGELGDPDQRAQIGVLREQVHRCRDAIDEMSRSAGELSASSGRAVRLDEWLSALTERWRNARPAATVTVRQDGSPSRVTVLMDRALEQAVASLLSNGVRTGTEVEMAACWSSTKLLIEVRDRGPGLPPALREVAGREPLGDRAGVSGLGLGLYLATGTVERLGGTLELVPRDGGGTVARLELPLDRLRIDESEGNEWGGPLTTSG